MAHLEWEYAPAPESSAIGRLRDRYQLFIGGRFVDGRGDDVKTIKTHNPFALNDVYLSREMGIAIDRFNNYGSSLIFGHPQGPTGTRLIIELIEELVLGGGGHGLFVGCAAGDSAAAIVLRVGR